MDEQFIDSSVGKNPFPSTISQPANAFYALQTLPPERSDELFFYVDAGHGPSGNRYIPSGWMGDYGDLRLSNSYMSNPSNSRTCLKITYSGRNSPRRWMGWEFIGSIRAIIGKLAWRI